MNVESAKNLYRIPFIKDEKKDSQHRKKKVYKKKKEIKKVSSHRININV